MVIMHMKIFRQALYFSREITERFFRIKKSSFFCINTIGWWYSLNHSFFLTFLIFFFGTPNLALKISTNGSINITVCLYFNHVWRQMAFTVKLNSKFNWKIKQKMFLLLTSLVSSQKNKKQSLSNSWNNKKDWIQIPSFESCLKYNYSKVVYKEVC